MAISTGSYATAEYFYLVGCVDQIHLTEAVRNSTIIPPNQKTARAGDQISNAGLTKPNLNRRFNYG